MKKYNHVIKGTNFHIHDNKSVKIIKKAAGKIPQSGIRYLDNETVILQSNSVHDILDAVKNKGWAHSSNPSRVKSGMTVIVVPNLANENLYGDGAVGLQFTATSDSYKDINNEFEWASE